MNIKISNVWKNIIVTRVKCANCGEYMDCNGGEHKVGDFIICRTCKEVTELGEQE